MHDVSVVMPAAGVGRRMGGGQKKQYLEVAGRPIIAHTVERMSSVPGVAEIVLACGKGEEDALRGMLPDVSVPVRIVEGGVRRQDSVHNALRATASTSCVVVIHDAVRPLVKVAHIAASIETARKTGAALVAVPVQDTLKRVENGTVTETVDRSLFWRAQTPQTFDRDLALKAFAEVDARGLTITDDSAAVEVLGHSVTITPGDNENIKITTPADLALFEAILSAD